MELLKINTKLGTIQVYKNGQGSKNVVLLHGAGCDNAMLSWREVINTFGEEFTVYAPDLLGYGSSQKPQNMCGPDFYEKHIDSVKEVVDCLGIQSCILAGLSMGGAIAIGFTLKYPEYVNLLVPVDSWGLSAKLPMHKICHWYIHNTDFTLKQYHWLVKSRLLAKWSISYSLIGKKENITEQLIDEVIEACKGDNAGQSMQDFQRSSSTKAGSVPYYIHELDKIDKTIVFINGDKDPLVPLKDVIAAAKKTRNNEYYILKDCKHWSVKEQPQEFVKIICEHIR